MLDRSSLTIPIFFASWIFLVGNPFPSMAFAWMGAQSTYDGPNRAEIEEREKKKEMAKCTLFINQLNTNTTKDELRSYFSSSGCVVLDCRIVYKNHESTGVAYIDVADEASMEKGLALHHLTFSGTKLQIRRHVGRSELLKLVLSKKTKTSSRLNSVKPNRSSSKVCYQFEQGECARGDNCRFLHNNKNSNAAKSLSRGRKKEVKKRLRESPTRSKNICFAMQKGRCSFGDKCKYSHEGRDDERRHKKSKDGHIAHT